MFGYFIKIHVHWVVRPQNLAKLEQRIVAAFEELDQDKLSPLLKLKYNNAIADAIAELGKPEEIGIFFTGFQKYLYERHAP